MRYVEIDGQLRKVVMVVKMRGGDHSKDICEYEITPHGLQVGPRLAGYRGLILESPLHSIWVPSKATASRWRADMSEAWGRTAEERSLIVKRLCIPLTDKSPVPTIAVEGLRQVIFYLNPAFAQPGRKDRCGDSGTAVLRGDSRK